MPGVTSDASDIIRDPARLAAVSRTGLLDSPPEEAFDRLARLAARTLNAPVAVISILDENRLFLKSRIGLTAEVPSELPFTETFCQYNVTLNRPLVINDAREHELVCNHPAVAAGAVRGYLGAPLINPQGHGLGILCVIDTEPRTWTDEQIAILTDLAAAVVTKIELHMVACQAKADLTELEQTQHALRTSNHRLALVSETAHHLLLEDDAQTFIKTLYEKLSAQLGLEVYFNYLITEDGSSLRLNCYAGVSEEVGRNSQIIEFGQGPCGWVAQHRRPLIMQNIQASSDINAETQHNLGVKAYACHPLMAQNELVGTLAFGSRRRSVFNLDELAVIEIVCKQVSVAIQRQRADDKLHHSEERYRLLYEDNPSMYFTLNAEGIVLSVNRFGTEQLGYGQDELVGQPVFMLVHEEDKNQVQEQFRAYIAQPSHLTHWEFRKVRKDGSEMWVREAVRSVKNPDGDTVVLVVCDDISDRKHIEEQLRHAASHDALTGLANQARFHHLLMHAITKAHRHPAHFFAVLFIDLDRFKIINDSLGHIIGDQLLVSIARRLETCVRPGDILARFGGDEFTVLVSDIADATEAVHVTNRIQATFLKPFHLSSGHEVHTSASIGIAMSTAGLEKAEDILRDADIAMYRAKSHGKGRYQLFEGGMHTHALKLWELESDLRRALECEELHVHYQPIVCLHSGRITGVEALARWQHPQHGLLYPEEFIPLAEETGLIEVLGARLLGLGCAQLKTWQRAGFPHLQLSVNFSAVQFQGEHLPDLIKMVLDETGLAPGSLKLEITESLAMKDIDYSIAALNELSAMGVQISIDDFGTGYSSLAYLRRFPINTIKIDHSFVRDITSDADDAAISAAIIAMAHSLKLDVVAEGVETEEQLDMLRAQRCDSIQGFLFSRALSADMFTDFLREGRCLPPFPGKTDALRFDELSEPRWRNKPPNH
ncbi:MAG: EAL domain-containing protein [Gammaproteobacteria bacterium]